MTAIALERNPYGWGRGQETQPLLPRPHLNLGGAREAGIAVLTGVGIAATAVVATGIFTGYKILDTGWELTKRTVNTLTGVFNFKLFKEGPPPSRKK